MSRDSPDDAMSDSSPSLSDEVCSLIHRYLDVCELPRFAVKDGETIKSRFLAQIMHIPPELGPSHNGSIAVRLARVIQRLAHAMKDPGTWTRDALNRDTKTLESSARECVSLESFHAACTLFDDFIKTPTQALALATQHAFEEFMKDLVDDWVQGRDMTAILGRTQRFFATATTLASLWDCTTQSKRSVIRYILYVATHVVYIQNDYGTDVGRTLSDIVGGPEIYTLVSKGIALTPTIKEKNTPDTELLAECMSILYMKDASCDAWWSTDVCQTQKRHPRLPGASHSIKKGTTWTYNAQVLHFVFTLIQALVGVERSR
jgi:hypothetical protein